MRKRVVSTLVMYDGKCGNCWREFVLDPPERIFLDDRYRWCCSNCRGANLEPPVFEALLEWLHYRQEVGKPANLRALDVQTLIHEARHLAITPERRGPLKNWRSYEESIAGSDTVPTDTLESVLGRMLDSVEYRFAVNLSWKKINLVIYAIDPDLDGLLSKVDRYGNRYY